MGEQGAREPAAGPAQPYPLAGIMGHVAWLRFLAASARATTGNLIVVAGAQLFCPSCRMPVPMLVMVGVFPACWACVPKISSALRRKGEA
jgi:hypothetical protein